MNKPAINTNIWIAQLLTNTLFQVLVSSVLSIALPLLPCLPLFPKLLFLVLPLKKKKIYFPFTHKLVLLIFPSFQSVFFSFLMRGNTNKYILKNVTVTMIWTSPSDRLSPIKTAKYLFFFSPFPLALNIPFFPHESIFPLALFSFSFRSSALLSATVSQAGVSVPYKENKVGQWKEGFPRTHETKQRRKKSLWMK